jgi:hypothetical protein
MLPKLNLVRTAFLVPVGYWRDYKSLKKTTDHFKILFDYKKYSTHLLLTLELKNTRSYLFRNGLLASFQ